MENAVDVDTPSCRNNTVVKSGFIKGIYCPRFYVMFLLEKKKI